MSKKIGLHIGGRRFDVDVEDDFAKFLTKEMAKDFNTEGNNDLKVVLQGYVRKVHDLYTQEKKMQELIDKIEI
ncbi:MAG: hypothetical protein JXQ67_10125 [Campylobacterales bacterium]|nr:hypothetical protein [Campylobacterales bacterium]